ncbi:MAG: hypothetical protein PHT12_00485 [Patescibacteria group bacterium]|nr:hypothetical protein [Patescibacteria group bacterium]
MQYLERTLQVRAALLGRPDLLERIRSVFASHVARDGQCQPIGRGGTRWAYEVGRCEVAPETEITVLLKLKKDEGQMGYEIAQRRSPCSDLGEFGAFDVYYDFVTGRLATVSFHTEAGYEQCSAKLSRFGDRVERSFSLADFWGGTHVERGDIGAIPYFQMVVRHRGMFGILTEGLPALVAPKGTASDFCTSDQHTVEDGRIIDLGSMQCLLVALDWGGTTYAGAHYPGNFRLLRRAERFFRRKSRLNL